MANKKHLAVLRQGVDVWNAWRRENPRTFPDISRADLEDANLYGADLRETDLSRAHFQEADLGQADLRRAKLVQANLGLANL